LQGVGLYEQTWLLAAQANSFRIDYGYHWRPPHDPDAEVETPSRRSWNSSVVSANDILGSREWRAYTNQQSSKIWNEPKDLMLTLVRAIITPHVVVPEVTKMRVF
jgi:hypothetical protein